MMTGLSGLVLIIIAYLYGYNSGSHAGVEKYRKSIKNDD